MGAGAGEIPAPTGGVASNYTITDADRLGDAPHRERFRRNVAAIETLRRIEQASRAATADEQRLMVQYVGWGGLPQVFATEKDAPKWADEQRALRALLMPEEYESARATVLNAHYTAPDVVRAMYAGLARLGFTHGRILEPACGLGHFLGLMPESMRSRSSLTGIEIDGLTARLARLLYPQADLRAEPFENASLPTNRFDLAVSNVPFGDYAPFDPRFNRAKFRIHDYYFAAAAERVRPGGLIAFITSRGTLDKQQATLRETIAQSCDFLGAIRLPHTAFKKIANTEVTTDIIFLRKRAKGEECGGEKWCESRPWLRTGPTDHADRLGPAVWSAFRSKNVRRVLAEKSTARSGPFDGGCLIVAKTLQQVFGEGDLVRLTSDQNGGQTEHYGLRAFGAIFDGAGMHASAAEWAASFRARENFTSALEVAEGWDEATEIPDDPAAVKHLARLVRANIGDEILVPPPAPPTIFLNEYFHLHPERMLGRLECVEGGPFGETVRLTDDGRDLGAALRDAMATLPSNSYRSLTEAEQTAIKQTIAAPAHVKPNAYVLTEEGGGGIARREGDELVLLTDLPLGLSRRIRRMIKVRDAARECLRTQMEDLPDAEVDAARAHLNQEYDHCVGQCGAISDPANVRAFAGDPDLPLLLSLENYDDETGTATKTAIFHERTIQRRRPVAAASGPQEALAITLSEKGRVDLGHMEKLLGRPHEEFLPDLSGVLFLNPVSQNWETDDDYLAGNVREKLRVADEAAAKDLRFRINAEALRAVQPTELKATEIDARLGAAWLPPGDVAAFARDLLRVPAHDQREVTVRHVPQLGLWSVDASHYAKTGVANTSEWGTGRIGAHELIEAALNLRTPTIYDIDANKNPIINIVATEGAREKQSKIKERFATWVWEDDDRRERLVAYYNEHYNHLRLRTFNGDHLTLPGASPAITLRRHQKAAVWRIVQSPNALLAHVVGAGKTYTMAAAAMELKRLGLARKPLFVVPNHMLGQFSTELLTLYPNAQVLAAGKADFESAKRRQLMSRIATGNWDAVIVTHSGFERLSMSAGAREEFLTDQLIELEDCIREQRETQGRSNTRLVKELERAKKKLEFKIKSLEATDKKDDTLTFEELGVDRLFVDEAQAFKNLFYTTKMTRVAGLPQTASERAFDMFLKVQYVQRLNGGGGVVFATGTPITNTMAEMFTMQRYLQMQSLHARHLKHFDAWAGTFGETVIAMELAPDGAGYRMNTRFARFVNVPELMQLFRQMADVQTAAMLKLPVPALDGGKATIVRAPATPELKRIVQSLAQRAENLKTHNVPPETDNMLKITGEGRKAALDLRLVGIDKDHPDGKVNFAVKQIHAIWTETAKDRLTQLVFCDLSTPQADDGAFSVYNDIRTKLVLRGVPNDDIAFIQDYDSDGAKLALFKDVRAGKVRILLGSTQKMGAGTNVQAKLVALHHLDAPWRPADIEQREGRILRQGNTNATVRIFRYVTEGSFDAYMWQTLETKAKFISQVMTGEATARKIEDLENPALTYAEVKAIASGNPLVIEKAKVDAEAMRLSRLRAEHQEAQFSARRRLRLFEEDIGRTARDIAAVERDLAHRQDTQGDNFKMKVDGRAYTERVKAGEALIYLVGGSVQSPETRVVGELAGFKIEFRGTLPETLTIRGASSYEAKISVSPLGIVSSLEHAVRSMEDRLAGAKVGQTNAAKSHRELSVLAGNIFEHEERYLELQRRQAELIEKLDITKNQASAQLATETEETQVVATVVSAGDTAEETGLGADESATTMHEVRAPRVRVAM